MGEVKISRLWIVNIHAEKFKRWRYRHTEVDRVESTIEIQAKTETDRDERLSLKKREIDVFIQILREIDRQDWQRKP